MFEGYTEEARRSIFFARYEAASLGETEIHTEHLLLGILKVNSSIAYSLLAFNLSDHTIREAIAKYRPAPKRQISTSKDVPFSAAAKRVLEYGAEEAKRLGQRSIGAMSLCLGLLAISPALRPGFSAKRGSRMRS